jgi:hypothetical protein
MPKKIIQKLFGTPSLARGTKATHRPTQPEYLSMPVAEALI